MTKKCTRDNPIGITGYDISTWAALPGWQKLAQTLNEVVLQARAADLQGNQDDLAVVLDHLARGIAYMDCCSQCQRAALDGPFVDTRAAPYATEVSERGVVGKYRCVNGHHWKCGYSIDAPCLGIA